MYLLMGECSVFPKAGTMAWGSVGLLLYPHFHQSNALNGILFHI